MERTEAEFKPRFDLTTVRGLTNAKTLNSTKNSRTADVLRYLYEVSEDQATDEDPIFYFQEYIPAISGLTAWISDNESRIDGLKRQDRRDYYTDSFDLHEESAQFSESAWMSSSLELCRLLSMDPIVIRANIALRLLYVEGHREYIDNRVKKLQSQANPSATPAA